MWVSTHRYISQLYLLSRPRSDDTLVIVYIPSPKVTCPRDSNPPGVDRLDPRPCSFCL